MVGALRLDEGVHLGAVLRLEQPLDLAAGLVVPTTEMNDACDAQGGQIAQHIAGAAQSLQLTLDR